MGQSAFGDRETSTSGWVSLCTDLGSGSVTRAGKGCPHPQCPLPQQWAQSQSTIALGTLIHSFRKKLQNFLNEFLSPLFTAHVCVWRGGQRTPYGTQFFPSSIGVIKTELRQVSLGSKCPYRLSSLAGPNPKTLCCTLVTSAPLGKPLRFYLRIGSTGS